MRERWPRRLGRYTSVVATAGTGFSCGLVRLLTAVARQAPRFCKSMRDNELITRPLLCQVSYGDKCLSVRRLRRFWPAVVTDHGVCRAGCRARQIYHRNGVATLGGWFGRQFPYRGRASFRSRQSRQSRTWSASASPRETQVRAPGEPATAAGSRDAMLALRLRRDDTRPGPPRPSAQTPC